MKARIALTCVTLILGGCAQIQYADGKTVAVRHMYQADPVQLQTAADQACLQSGGRAPAKLVASVPIAQVAVQFSDWTYTFHCAQ